MATPSPTWTRALALLAVLFAVLSTGNAINKGGDAAVFFEGGRRFLAVEPLYAGSSAADGFIGPPFQAAFFAPFAALSAVSPVAARLLWHALNLACFALGVWWSLEAWNAARGRLGLSELTWLPMLFAPLAAILLPLQTNFEHQNMNALLLAFIAGATVQLLARLGDCGWGLYRNSHGAESISGAAHRLLAGPPSLDRRARGHRVGNRALDRVAARHLRLCRLHRSGADVLATWQQRLASARQ